MSRPSEDLEERFAQIWHKLPIAKRVDVVLLLSGGGDSVALFHLLRKTGVSFSCRHFVHDSPGRFARDSRQFCLELCLDYGVSCEVTELLVSPLMQEGDLSWEAAARQLRYRALTGESQVFLTAHTADDQAETILLRLLDGSGLAGLAGIRRSRGGRIFRPLLEFRRSELRVYLKQGGLTWVEDPTNINGNDRARLRHQILPSLEGHSPGLIERLLRTSRLLALDEDALSSTARRELGEAALGPDCWLLDRLVSLPEAVRYRAVREIWRTRAPAGRRPLGSFFVEVERLLNQGGDNRRVLLPDGSCLRRLGPRLWLEPRLSSSDYLFPVSELVQSEGSALPEFLSVKAGPGSEFPVGCLPLRLPVSCLNMVDCAVRSRRPKDRFRGLDLKKLLSTTGHPPWVRDRWPILVCGQQVLGVAGDFGWDEQVRLTPDPGDYWLGFFPGKLRTEIKKMSF